MHSNCILTCFFPFPFFLSLRALFLLFEHQEQKRIDGTTREVKKVRKARNRRQEWNMMAYDKELRPDNRLSQSVYHGASSEGSLSPDTRSVYNQAVSYAIVVCSQALSRIRCLYRLGVTRMDNTYCVCFKTLLVDNNINSVINDIFLP